MSAQFTGSQYIEWTNNYNSRPLTISLWFRPNGISGTTGLFSMANAAGTERYVVFQSSEVFDVYEDPAGSRATASGIVNGAWNHGAGVYFGTNLRLAYLNGVAGAVSGSGASPTAATRSAIGGRYNSSSPPGLLYNGDVAEVAIWSAELAAAEILSLSKGVSPMLVRPDSLRHYLPLVRDFRDMKGASLSITGSLIPAEHPRTYR